MYILPYLVMRNKSAVRYAFFLAFASRFRKCDLNGNFGDFVMYDCVSCHIFLSASIATKLFCTIVWKDLSAPLTDLPHFFFFGFMPAVKCASLFAKLSCSFFRGKFCVTIGTNFYKLHFSSLSILICLYVRFNNTPQHIYAHGKCYQNLITAK